MNNNIVNFLLKSALNKFSGTSLAVLQYSCLENSLDRGAWLAKVHWVTKSWTQMSTTSPHTL